MAFRFSLAEPRCELGVTGGTCAAVGVPAVPMYAHQYGSESARLYHGCWQQHDCFWGVEVCTTAVNAPLESLAVLMFLHDGTATDASLTANSVICSQYAVENGYPIRLHTCAKFSRAGRLKLSIWLRPRTISCFTLYCVELGWPIDAETM